MSCWAENEEEERLVCYKPLNTLPLSKGLQATHYRPFSPSRTVVKCAARERMRDLWPTPAENAACYVSHRGNEQMGAVLFSRLGPRWLTFLAGSRELTTQHDSGSNPKVFHLSEKRDCSLSGPQLKEKNTTLVSAWKSLHTILLSSGWAQSYGFCLFA